MKQVHSKFDTKAIIYHQEISSLHFVFLKFVCYCWRWEHTQSYLTTEFVSLNTQLNDCYLFDIATNSEEKGFIKMRWHVITNIKMCCFSAVEMGKCWNVWHNVKFYVVSPLGLFNEKDVSSSLIWFFKCHTYIDTILEFSLPNVEKSLVGLLATVI